MSRSLLAPLMVVVAGLASLTLAAGDGSGCPSGDISQDCEIPGDLTVAQGHALAIQGATVRFTGTATFTVAGSLDLTDATIEAADGIELQIRFLPGSDVRLRDSAIMGYGSLQVAGDFSVDNLTLDASGTALDVETSVEMHDVAITARDGVHVAANRSVGLVGGSITASRDAVVAADGAAVRFEDTVLSSGSVDLEGTAVLEESFHVLLNVSAAGTGDVDAAFRDAAGVVQAEGQVTPDDPASFLLPGQVRTSAGTVAFSPYFVSAVQSAVQGSSASHAFLDLVQPGQELDVEVPDDPDADEPEWPVSEPLRHDGAFPGFSGDGDVRIAWRAADDTMGLHDNRAVDHYEVFVGGFKTTETRDTAVLLEGLDPGSYMVRVDAVDLVGNRNGSDPVQILVDTAVPTLSVETDPAPSALGAHTGPVDVQVTAKDADSGLRALRWRIGEGMSTQVDLCADPCRSQTFQVPLDAPGVHPLHVVAQDQAGTRTETTHNITIDTSSPLFIVSIEPDLPAGAWHREPPMLHVNATDPGPSGPGQVRWRLGDGPWQNHSAPAALEAVGEHTVHVELTDGAGNVAGTQLRHALDPDAPVLAVDTTGPVGLAGWSTGPTNASVTASDDLSGVERLEYRLGAGAWRPSVQAVALHEDGVHAVTFRAVDAAGNEAVQTLNVSIDSRPPQAPGVEWSVLADGRIRADWSRAPPMDAASGVVALRVERGEESHEVPPTALGHVLIGLPAAEHSLRVVATDAAGHESATAWRTVQGGNDTGATASSTDARGVVLVSPDPTVSSADLLEVHYHVDGSLVSSQAEPPYAFRWDTRSLDNGPHQLRIVAVDADGIHHEESRTYNVRNGYLAALADGAWAAGVAIAVALGSAAAAVNGLRSWRREGVA